MLLSDFPLKVRSKPLLGGVSVGRIWGGFALLCLGTGNGWCSGGQNQGRCKRVDLGTAASVREAALSSLRA